VAGAEEFSQRALELCRESGYRFGEARVLNGLGIVGSDLARQRAYFEQTLAIAPANGFQAVQSMVENNLGLLYFSLGLYGRACDHTARAIQMQRELRAYNAMAAALESLGRALIELGEYEAAQKVLDEGLTLSRNEHDRFNEAYYLFALGKLDLARGDIPAATARFEEGLPLAIPHGLQPHFRPSAPHLAEVRGLTNQVIRRLERIEGDILTERHARVDE